MDVVTQNLDVQASGLRGKEQGLAKTADIEHLFQDTHNLILLRLPSQNSMNCVA